MNGARTTFLRRGYLLTALAAAALLAASPGTAVAQTGVTITGPAKNTVNEGGTATYTVEIDGYIEAATDTNDNGRIDGNEYVSATSLTVTLATPTAAGSPGTGNTAGEVGATDSDLGTLSGSVNFDVPSNDRAVPKRFTASKTITQATKHDNDAENEEFTLAFTLSGDGGLDTTATGDVAIALATAGEAGHPNALIIDDDETQSYVLALTPNQTTPPTEGTAFTVDLKASPDHVQGSQSLQVNIDKPTGWTLVVEDNTNPTTVDSSDDGKTRTITITQTDDDGNRVVDTVTVSAWKGSTVGQGEQIASLSIDVADGDALQAVTAKVVDKNGVILNPQPTSVEEGKSVMIAVMPLDKNGTQTTANEALKITLASSSGSADARDFRLSAPIAIVSGQVLSNVVELIAEEDEDVGMETLILDATVSGEDANGKETSMSAGRAVHRHRRHHDQEDSAEVGYGTWCGGRGRDGERRRRRGLQPRRVVHGHDERPVHDDGRLYRRHRRLGVGRRGHGVGLGQQRRSHRGEGR